jgi:hypothetical protein
MIAIGSIHNLDLQCSLVYIDFWRKGIQNIYNKSKLQRKRNEKNAAMHYLDLKLSLKTPLETDDYWMRCPGEMRWLQLYCV